MLKNKTLLCISNNTCHAVYENKHLLCLIYGRVLTKARNYVVTWNFTPVARGEGLGGFEGFVRSPL